MIIQYDSMEDAMRSINRRSFAAGTDSEFEVRYCGEVFVGGAIADLNASPFKDSEVIARYKGGYKC